MKKLCSLMLLLSMCLMLGAQKTFFSCDFNKGIPENFALYDEDGNTPSKNAKEYGFEIGKPWISYQISSRDPSNLAILSTSLYSPLGTSNDWIVTPAIKIDSEHAFFMWKAGNMSDAKDGYKILVSTKGQKVEDFAGADVIYETKAGEKEKQYIYTHSASLKKYVGQTVYIAVINNSTNKSFLLMDDFWAGELFQSTAFLNLTENVINDNEEECSIKCAIKNNGIIDFEQEVTVHMEMNGNTITKELGLLKLTPQFGKTVTFPRIQTPETGESSNYTITLTYTDELGEKVVKTINSALHRLGSVYSRKVVVEEATGTWCAYCPRGTVGMKAMKEKYPDTFIGIAAHCGDIMQVPEYMQEIESYIEGFPAGIVNRTAVIDPSVIDLESQYKKEIIKPTVASVKIKNAEFGEKDSTLIRVNVSSAFAFNSDHANLNFRYTFIVIENDVRGTGSYYDQANAYSGGSQRMGGFESLPDPVPSSLMSYQEVARYSAPFMGIAESIPGTIEKDKEVSYEYTFPTPKTIFKKKNIEVIALLIDRVYGKIWNADKIAAKDMGHNPSISSIETIRENRPSLQTYLIGSDLLISWDSTSTSPAHIELFGPDGKKVKDAFFENISDDISVPVNDLKGIYIIKVSNGKDIAVGKIAL